MFTFADKSIDEFSNEVTICVESNLYLHIIAIYLIFSETDVK